MKRRCAPDWSAGRVADQFVDFVEKSRPAGCRRPAASKMPVARASTWFCPPARKSAGLSEINGHCSSPAIAFARRFSSCPAARTRSPNRRKSEAARAFPEPKALGEFERLVIAQMHQQAVADDSLFAAAGSQLAKIRWQQL